MAGAQSLCCSLGFHLCSEFGILSVPTRPPSVVPAALACWALELSPPAGQPGLALGGGGFGWAAGSPDPRPCSD